MDLSEATNEHVIIDETRRSIMDAILAIGSLKGDMEYHQFAKKVCPSLNDDVISEIARHMDRFDDWPESYLLESIIDCLQLSDDQFGFFLEQYVNPNIHHYHWSEEERRQVDVHNSKLVALVNSYLEHDGYKLVIKDTIGDKDFYQCITTRVGVYGSIKNIIFAAKYKPEIAFTDALNNDVLITKNQDQCLIYDRAIPQNGVTWGELLSWYTEKYEVERNPEVKFVRRLCDCLDVSFKEKGETSGPETWMLQAYYELKKQLGDDIPALIPQVYLYYDPQTLQQRGYKLFEHQKMDFLMIFSHRDRVVIEIDGKQHYANSNTASPQLYSAMVAAHREMSLLGYDVYRFGGYEFYGAKDNDEIKRALIENLKQFFRRLFEKYGIQV